MMNGPRVATSNTFSYVLPSLLRMVTLWRTNSGHSSSGWAGMRTEDSGRLFIWLMSTDSTLDVDPDRRGIMDAGGRSSSSRKNRCGVAFEVPDGSCMIWWIVFSRAETAGDSGSYRCCVFMKA